MSMVAYSRQYTDVERQVDQLSCELTRLKRMTAGWRSLDDYATALKFYDEVLMPQMEKVRKAIEEAYVV
jgi:hypothetical protein